MAALIAALTEQNPGLKSGFCLPRMDKAGMLPSTSSGKVLRFVNGVLAETNAAFPQVLYARPACFRWLYHYGHTKCDSTDVCNTVMAQLFEEGASVSTHAGVGPQSIAGGGAARHHHAEARYAGLTCPPNSHASPRPPEEDGDNNNQGKRRGG